MKSSYFLAIETSTREGSLSLHRGEEVVATYAFGKKGRHGGALAPSVQDCLRQYGLSPHEIEFVAASLGPGSFTGLRVGLAFAMAFCRATGSKFVGVPTLDAVAEKLYREKGGWAKNPLVFLLDARRDSLYVGIYSAQEKEVVRQGELFVVKIEEARERLPEEATLVGNGVKLLPGLAPGWNVWEVECQAEACWVGRLAWRLFQRGEGKTPPFVVEPLYLLKPPSVK